MKGEMEIACFLVAWNQ